MDLTETLEEIYSLLLIIGHVLADEVEGETPSVSSFQANYYASCMVSLFASIYIGNSLVILVIFTIEPHFMYFAIPYLYYFEMFSFKY